MACITRLMCIIFLLCAALVGTAQASTKVLFDTAHGEKFKTDDDAPLQLSHFAGVLREQGVTIASAETPLSDATLKDVDALILSGAFKKLAPEEIEAVTRFLERGGRLCVMLHIAPPLEGLLNRLNVSYTNGVILEREGKNVLDIPLNFRVTRLSDHPVLRGMKGFAVYGAWGVINRNAASHVIATSSPDAWIDLRHDGIPRQEATGAFGVAVAGDVGKGAFVVFGDDAIFQNKFLEGDNKDLAVNLAKWLSAPPAAKEAPHEAKPQGWI